MKMVDEMTYQGLDYMASILQMLFPQSNVVVFPDNKIHGANKGPIWVLSAPDGPHVGPMNHAIRVVSLKCVPEDQIDRMSPLVRVMACCQTQSSISQFTDIDTCQQAWSPGTVQCGGHDTVTWD